MKTHLSQVSRKLKIETRKAINLFKRSQVEEIQKLEPDDARRMWKELKVLSGWNRKEEVDNTVLDEKTREISGEGVMKVWKEAFRSLGVENVKDEKFDIEFCKKTIENQEEIEAESHDLTNFNPALDSPITQEETTEAIRKLKLGKASGCDGMAAEILVKGGDQVQRAVYVLCQKYGRGKHYRKNGQKESYSQYTKTETNEIQETTEALHC